MKVPRENYGPQSLFFDESNSALYILDAGNSRILELSSAGNLFSVLSIEAGGDDFVRSQLGDWFVLNGSDHQVVHYSPSGALVDKTRLPASDWPAIGIRLSADGTLMIDFLDESSVPVILNEGGLPQSSARSRGFEWNGSQYYLRRESGGDGTIEVLNRDGSIKNVIRVQAPASRVDSLVLAGVDRHGNLYLTVEDASGPNSMPVLLYLRKYSPNGELLAESRIPYSSYVHTFRDLRVTEDGRVLQLLPFKDSVEVLAWEPAQPGEKAATNLVSRAFSRMAVSPDDFLPGEAGDQTAEPAAPVAALTPQASAQPVLSRSQVLATAIDYYNLTYSVSSRNITTYGPTCSSGGIDDQNGAQHKIVKTPVCTLGDPEMNMPYQWGGFSTVQGFRDGIAAGLWAGDKCTDSDPQCKGIDHGSPKAVGVDCSGFVSRTWGLQSHLSVAQLGGVSCCLSGSCLASTPPTFDSSVIKPGDILVSALKNGGEGHVRLVYQIAANGPIAVYESSARGWKVDRNFYAYTDLTVKGKYYYPYRGGQITVPMNSGNAVRAIAQVPVYACAGLSCATTCKVPAGTKGTLTGASSLAGGFQWWQVAWSGASSSCSGWSQGCDLDLDTSPAATFSISVNSTSQTVTQGQNSVFTLTVQSLNGFTAKVTPSAQNLPAGVGTSWNPVTITPAANGKVGSTLTIATSSSTTPATYNVTLQAAATGYKTQTVPVTITVNKAAALPTISSFSISPSTISSGGQAKLTVQLSGAAAANGATVNLGPTGNAVFPVSSINIAAGQTTGTYTATAGTVTKSTVVTITASYNGSTKQASVTVNPAAPPAIGNISPTTMTASATTLTTLYVNGSNFSTSGGQLLFTDPAKQTYSSKLHPERIVSVNSTQWVYNINNGGAVGPWSVQVINADGQGSGLANFSVTSALPTIAGFTISPSTVTSGGQATLNVQLSGPAQGNGAVISLSPTGNTAFPVASSFTIAAGQSSGSYTPNAGTVTTSTQVWITAAYNGSSKQALVTVNPALLTPSISSVNPASMPGSGSNQPLAIYGSNFQTGDTLTFTDPQGRIYQSDSSRLSISPPSQISYQFNNGNDPGPWRVVVNSPDNARHSNSVTFTVVSSAPVISSLSPNPMAASSSSQPLTITGTNFQSGDTLTMLDPQSHVYQSNPAKLTVSPPGKIVYQLNNSGDRGSWQITVNSPDGSQHSNTVYLTVQ